MKTPNGYRWGLSTGFCFGAAFGNVAADWRAAIFFAVLGVTCAIGDHKNKLKFSPFWIRSADRTTFHHPV